MASATFLEREPNEEARIAAWAAQIAAGDLSAVTARFLDSGWPQGPTLVWQPQAQDVTPPQLKFLLGYWHARKGERLAPPISAIDPFNLRPALGYIAILEPLEGGRDFRFRLYGTAIAAAGEFDMTGETLSALRANAHLVEYELALHRAVLKRAAPAYTWHVPPATVSSAIWHRLVLPFATDSGEIVRFMTGVVPVQRPEPA
jgi:hypothetical protein